MLYLAAYVAAAIIVFAATALVVAVSEATSQTNSAGFAATVLW